ncbi:DNA primase [uncultured Acetobacteroides sp.]|uniref:DNA primase n=1 Tax=uncultured Acetobacteroides sp. TaxID=1760811 RepID=UPI0029F53448|nr:DNA primase [uncultured Acetobacteroides sp.]
MIDKTTVDRIIDAANIVEVVGEFVSLKKRGVNHLGCCPFHNEKTPSFTVSGAKGIFKCFGCGKAGNSVSFIMEHEKLDYVDALRFLAKKYGIEIKERELSAQEMQQNNDRESMMVLSAFAQKHFTDTLFNHVDGKTIGMSYFRERGFRDDIIKKFQLGYCLDTRSAFSQYAAKQGYKKDFLVKTGLSVEHNDDLFDRFHGRVMFPIHSISGRVIGFGGRTLKTDKKVAKYLNSPESEIYHKSFTLYGIFFAKKSITQENRCYLVEGYTDVLSMHQAGIENVVASSGTSLTTEQIRLIKRFTNNVTVLYDGDAAGIKASLRGIDMILEEGLNVKVVLLPDGEDPDSFAKSHSVTELRQYIADSEADFISFKTKLLLKDADNDPIKRAGLITDVMHSISVIPDTIIRSVYIRECSRMFEVAEETLIQEMSSLRSKKMGVAAAQQFNAAQQARPERQTPAIPSFVSNVFCEEQEKEIIYFLLRHANVKLFRFTDDSGEELEMSVGQYIISEIANDELEFLNLEYRQIFDDFAVLIANGEEPKITHFIHHENLKISELVINLQSDEYVLSNIWKKFGQSEDNLVEFLSAAVPKAVTNYKAKVIALAIKNMMEELKNITEEDFEEMTMRITALNQVRTEIAKQLERPVLC